MALVAITASMLCARAARGQGEQGDPAIPRLAVTARMDGFNGDGPVSLFSKPDGGGRRFADAYGPGGVAANAVVTVIITIADSGEPVAYFPAEDIWLDSIPDATELGLVACGGRAIADGSTDTQGETVFADRLHAGGQSTNFACVVVMGEPALDSVLPLWFNSSDINGDGVVNLTDGGAFATILFDTYDYAADFNFDSAVNISDAGHMASSLGAACPQ